MIILVIVQAVCLLCAFFGIGQAVAKNAPISDQAFGYFICALFLVFTIVVEVVFK